jgi:predicted RNase H-like HicB family nuclease
MIRPASKEVRVKGYIFDASTQQEEDGRWSAWIEALPGCASWGYSREEALEALKDAAELYIEDMIEEGEELPKEGVQVVESPVVAVNL